MLHLIFVILVFYILILLIYKNLHCCPSFPPFHFDFWEPRWLVESAHPLDFPDYFLLVSLALFLCPLNSPTNWMLDLESGLLLLLLRSHFSHVWLCVTPALGFSRQEHWSGLPFPSPTHKSEKWKWSRSVMSDSLQPHGLQPTRLLRPWDFPGKSTGVGCHCLLQVWIGSMIHIYGWGCCVGGMSHCISLRSKSCPYISETEFDHLVKEVITILSHVN